MVEIPYYEENENASKHVIKKIEIFPNQRYRTAIKWITRKVKLLFKVKSQNPHFSCVIYRGKCSCPEEYVGETVRNLKKRWSEHNNPINKTEPAMHLFNNFGHLFA